MARRRFKLINAGGNSVEVNDLTAAVTWATVPDANISQSSVTQHEAALSITESQISDFGTNIGNTFTATQYIAKTSGPHLVLRDSDNIADSNQSVGWIRWEGSDLLRMGFVGYGSSGNKVLSVNNDIGDITLSPTTKVTVTGNLTIDPDSVGPMLDLGDGAGATGDILLKFNMDRSWQFEQFSTGASTALYLRSNTDGKAFRIVGPAGNVHFNWVVSDAGQPTSYVYNNLGTQYLAFYHNGTNAALESSTGAISLDPANGLTWAYTPGTTGELRQYSSTGAHYVRLYHTTANAYLNSSSGGIYLDSASGLTNLYNNGVDSVLRVWGSLGANRIDVSHDDTDGIVSTSAGKLKLSPQTYVEIASGVDLNWENASQPWLTLDSTSSGDNWTDQGAGISVGESGKKGSAAIHMTYNGNGSGYIGMGTVDNTVFTGGRPGAGHFDFTYNNHNILVGGRLFPGLDGGTTQSTRYIDTPTAYGSINVAGTTTAYAGYSINNDIHFMSNGTTHGLFNGGSTEWMIQSTDDSSVKLFFNNIEEIRTQNSDATGNTAGAEVKKHDQNWIDVGYNVMPREQTNASFTWSAAECGGYAYYNNSTAYTITLASTTDIPTDARMEVIQLGTGNITISAGTNTLYWFAGSGAPSTGNRTVGAGGWATIHKYAATVFFITGTGIT